MLRSLALALLGFSLLAGPAAARGDGGGRRAEAKAAAVAAWGAKAERSPLLLRRAFAVRLAPTPSGVLAVSCGKGARGGAPRCRGAAAHPAVHSGWAHGLPPALHVQAQECPAGTMATLAEGHDDVVRCIPI